MLMVIFKVTDDNQLIGVNAETYELWRMPLNQKEADFFRRQIKIDIMPRVLADKTPGTVFGHLTIATPI